MATQIGRIDIRLVCFLRAISLLKAASELVTERPCIDSKYIYLLHNIVRDSEESNRDEFVESFRQPTANFVEEAIGRINRFPGSIYSLIEIELLKLYYSNRFGNPSHTSARSHNMRLAILHYTTGDYTTAMYHSELARRALHDSSSVEKQHLPNFGHDLDNAVGLAVLLQYANHRTPDSNALTLRLLAGYTHVRCMQACMHSPNSQTAV